MITAKLKIVLILLGVSLLLLGSSGAKRHDQFKEEPIGTPHFAVDYAVFMDLGNNSKYNIELYAKIPLKSLYTIIQDGKEISKYEFAIIIRDKHGKQITGKSWDNKLENDKESLRDVKKSPAILEKQVFNLPRQQYSIEFLLTDKISNSQNKHIIKIDLKSYGKRMIISGVEFVQGNVPQSDILENNFTKYGERVIPLVSRSFDSESDAPEFYYEIYPSKNTPDILKAKYRIISTQKGGMYSQMEEVVLQDTTEGVKPVIERLHISQLPPGEYILDIELWDTALKKKFAERKADFEIGWSLKTLVENDYKTAVDELRYIATAAERDSLKKVPKDRRLEAIRDFWKRHDPTPSTPENELHDEYYSRVKYANNNFSGYGRPGYLTDFGRIYITYGKPEEIERHPFEMDSIPYEIWYYYRYHRKFIFVDRTGFGSYELADPFSEGLKIQ